MNSIFRSFQKYYHGILDRSPVFSPQQATIILAFLFLYLIGLLFVREPAEVISSRNPSEATSTLPFLPESPIDLNTADFHDLQLLPFIGPGYATRILEYRQRQGGFKDVHELKNIRGISAYKFEKLRDCVIVR